MPFNLLKTYRNLSVHRCFKTTPGCSMPCNSQSTTVCCARVADKASASAEPASMSSTSVSSAAASLAEILPNAASVSDLLAVIKAIADAIVRFAGSAARCCDCCNPWASPCCCLLGCCCCLGCDCTSNCCCPGWIPLGPGGVGSVCLSPPCRCVGTSCCQQWWHNHSQQPSKGTWPGRSATGMVSSSKATVDGSMHR